MTSNCLASVSIGCLFCIQRCNVEKIRVAFTFLPPEPSYTVETVEAPSGQTSDDRGKIVYTADVLKNLGFYQQAAEHAEVRFVRTARGERCPLVWLRPSGSSSACDRPAKDQPLVILHCHGNATDAGMMMGPYFELSKQLGIEVVGVEYSGYGQSTGSPSAANTYADIEAAYDHLIAQGVPAEKIVAYGQSVGSGPATYIGWKRKVGGVILHSPLMSGIKVIDPDPDKCCRPSCVFGCCDFFPNDARLKKVTCPAFVIHGQLDDIVPFHHGHRLSEMTPESCRWPGYFPKGAGHNNIVESNVRVYYQELAKFLHYVWEQASGSGSEGTGVQHSPVQIEMAEKLGTKLGASEADSNGRAAFADPIVGPEDSRYAGMRGEKATPSGDARTLQQGLSLIHI